MAQQQGVTSGSKNEERILIYYREAPKTDRLFQSGGKPHALSTRWRETRYVISWRQYQVYTRQAVTGEIPLDLRVAAFNFFRCLLLKR